MLKPLEAEYLVVGAGPAGLTTARLLALKGRKVIVIDPDQRKARRLELLAPAALATVAAIGLRPLLDDPTIARPCLGIRRTRDAAEDAEYEDFLRHPNRTGYVIDRLRFDAHLRVAAAAAGVEFHRLRVTGLMPDGRGVRGRAGRGGERSIAFSKVLIDATGRAAMIARRKGARVSVRDRLVGELVEETSIDGREDAASWLEYQSDGSTWSYRIHGPGGQAQTWRVGRLSRATGDAFLRVDASAGILSAAAGDGWIAVGDAAISFDPITSQGLFNALSSALVATGALLSVDEFGSAVARSYSQAVAATFVQSEIGRSIVYSEMTRSGTTTIQPTRGLIRRRSPRILTGAAYPP
jgi:flavin-dependent dehydrogenase